MTIKMTLISLPSVPRREPASPMRNPKSFDASSRSVTIRDGQARPLRGSFRRVDACVNHSSKGGDAYMPTSPPGGVKELATTSNEVGINRR